MLKIFCTKGEIKKYKIVIRNFYKSSYMITIFNLSDTTKTITSYIDKKNKIMLDIHLKHSIIFLHSSCQNIAEDFKKRNLDVRII